MEFLRAANGDTAASLAVLGRDDDSLSPRARALSRLAVTLTSQPWALTQDVVEDACRQGLDQDQAEAAVGVISMFNYFTRVADATGIEFDYETPLPAFEPDRRQVTATRPGRPDSSAPDPAAAPGHGTSSCRRRGNRGGPMCWKPTSRSAGANDGFWPA